MAFKAIEKVSAGRSRSRLLAALAAVCLAGACAGPGPNARGTVDNVVIILIDTLRQDHLSLYGYPRETSPVLDRLGKEGAVLDGLSPTSWTKPAAASLLTGLHPLRHQAIGRDDSLPAEALTLAEILQERGYHTLAVTANGWVSEKFGFDQGFDEMIRVHGEKGPATGVADLINATAVPRLKSLSTPFFLYVHYIDPHAPYDPPRAWDGSPLTPELARRAPLSDKQLHFGGFTRRPRELMQATIDLYDGEIRYVDAAIGQLLDAMRAQGLLESTLTVVTSDHGEELEDHLRIGHGRTLYNEVTRVPLIFNAPGLIPAGIRLGTVNLVDVAPTVLDLLGLVPQDDLDIEGVSRAAALFDPSRFDGDRRAHLLHLDLDSKSSLALVEGDTKLVLSPTPYRKELFVLGDDAGEQHNQIENQPARLRELSQELAASYNALRKQAFQRVLHNADQETKKALEALGYVAPTGKVEPRSIPHRIRQADESPLGLLGWEDLSGLDRCLAPADPGAARQLLAGWYRGERHGRWTEGRASALLEMPEPAGGDARRLRLEGETVRVEPFTLTLRVAGETVFEDQVAGGSSGLVAIEAPLASRIPAGPALLELTVDPPFVSQPTGRVDGRVLGVFVTSLCVTAGAEAPGSR